MSGRKKGPSKPRQRPRYDPLPGVTAADDEDLSSTPVRMSGPAHPVDGRRRGPRPVTARETDLERDQRTMTLGLLMDATAERQVAEDRVARRVQLAREAGATWEQVGRALGVTKQAAQKRYGRPS